MKRLYSVLTIVSLITAGFVIMLYYKLSQGDFVSQKKPKVIEETKQRDRILLSAAYKKDADYCKVDLVDSVNIAISVADSIGEVVLMKTYRITGDTIIILGGISSISKYINPEKFLISEKFLIKGKKIFYLLNRKGEYDSTRTMDIAFNKIKK